MLVPFGEHERRATVPYGLNDLGADDSIPGLVVHQELVERLELDSFVRTCAAASLKRSWTDDNGVLERSCGRLRLSVDAMPHRTALHEDDRMMAILPGDRRGQTQDVSSLRPTDRLFKVVKEDAVAVTAPVLLQWQRDQIAKSSVRRNNAIFSSDEES
ncbi:MAG: hypothetical protein HYS05_10250 [Acidobacteria bacterium]|nr:hypothetical protein [Acidobacteriota bacterium]